MLLKGSPIIVIAVLILSVLIHCPAIADDAPVNGTDLSNSSSVTNPDPDFAKYDGDLSAFEQKLFARTFPNDSVDARLDRIERIVYGSQKSGTVEQRIFRLMLDAPNIGVVVPAPPLAPAENAAAPMYTASDYGSYPTVTALEEQILGKANLGLPVQQRIADLEIKAFGQASNDPNMASRIDKLKAYVASKNSGESYLASDAPISSSVDDGSLIAQVGAMEQEVFGKTYTHDTLVSRLDRLDKTVFAGQSEQAFTPITQRINRLMAALQPKITVPLNPQTAFDKPYPYYNSRYSKQNSGPYQTDSSYARASSSANDTTVDDKEKNKDKSGHPVWHKFGEFLAGAGEAAGVALGAAAEGAAMSGYGYGYGYGYGGYGWGYPGFYGGGYPFGYGYGPRPFMGYY